MKSLLVPTDFSPTGNNAIEYAAQLAKQFDASILLFHAYMIPTPVSELSYAMVTIDELQQTFENNLKKQAADIQSKYGVEMEWLIRMGIASDEIKVLAGEREINLIVMGMKGAGGLDKIIGSTTTNVIRKVKTPVLIVPQDARYEPVKDIIYSTDFTYSSSATLFNPLLDIASDFHPDIHVLHVEKGNGHNGTEELTGKKDIENILAEYPHDYVSIKDESVTHGINEYLQHHHTNMLVMVAHKHNFFERVFSRSNTTAMAYETRVPLMVLQDKES